MADDTTMPVRATPRDWLGLAVLAVILTSSVSACLAIVAAAVVGTALRNVR